MSIDDYKQIIKDTKVYPNSTYEFGPAYCYFGLLGEFNELQTAVSTNSPRLAIMSEISDVYWYITALALELNLNYEFIMTMNKEDTLKDISILSLAEPLKKYYRDDKPINKAFFEEVLKNLSVTLNIVSKNNGFTQAEVLEYNYNKLMKRRELNKLNGDGSFREL